MVYTLFDKIKKETFVLERETAFTEKQLYELTRDQIEIVDCNKGAGCKEV